MNYIAKADIEAYMGVALTGNGIALFNLLSPAMQAMVDRYCNRSWNVSNPITETFDAFTETVPPTFVNTFFVKYPKISSTVADVNYPKAGGIISVTVDGEPFDMQYVYNYGTHLKIDMQPQSMILLNSSGYQTITVVYNLSLIHI